MTCRLPFGREIVTTLGVRACKETDKHWVWGFNHDIGDSLSRSTFT